MSWDVNELPDGRVMQLGECEECAGCPASEAYPEDCDRECQCGHTHDDIADLYPHWP